ncbi:MAG: NUDIX domain-containing protein [Hyphomonadaceae bacterium]|nr:NUDIX domain-containing protein [Hyphomonadaceae bacterium]
MTDLRTQVFRIWFRLSRWTTLGARAVVENDRGEILLVRQTYSKGLLFPGGGVEHGETMMTALSRELEEEGGVRLTAPAQLFSIYSNHKIMRNDHVALYRVAASDWIPFGDPIGYEISELVWCDPRAPHADATPGTQRRLREIYADAPIADHW